MATTRASSPIQTEDLLEGIVQNLQRLLPPQVAVTAAIETNPTNEDNDDDDDDDDDEDDDDDDSDSDEDEERIPIWIDDSYNMLSNAVHRAVISLDEYVTIVKRQLIKNRNTVPNPRFLNALKKIKNLRKTMAKALDKQLQNFHIVLEDLIPQNLEGCEAMMKDFASKKGKLSVFCDQGILCSSGACANPEQVNPGDPQEPWEANLANVIIHRICSFQCSSTETHCTGVPCSCKGGMRYCLSCLANHYWNDTNHCKKSYARCPQCRGEFCMRDISFVEYIPSPSPSASSISSTSSKKRRRIAEEQEEEC